MTISDKQLYTLSGMARKAWEAHGKFGYDPAKRNATKAFDAFRKAALFAKTSNKVQSWKLVLNADFETLLAYFSELAGEAGVQFNAEKSKADQPRLRKIAAMGKALVRCGQLTGDDKWCMGYAVTIAKRQYGGGLDKITLPELHRVLLTVISRTRDAVKAHAEAAMEADLTAENAESAENEFDEATTFADADASAMNE